MRENRIMLLLISKLFEVVNEYAGKTCRHSHDYMGGL